MTKFIFGILFTLLDHTNMMFDLIVEGKKVRHFVATLSWLKDCNDTTVHVKMFP